MTYTKTHVTCPACGGDISDEDAHGDTILWAFCPWCGRSLTIDDPARVPRSWR